MKRRALLIATFIVTVVIISSCKTRERCPAYGNNTHNQTEKTIA